MTPSNLREIIREMPIKVDITTRDLNRYLAYESIDAIIAAVKSSLDAIELPDGNSIVQPDLSEVPESAHWVYFKGQKHMLTEVQTALKKYKESL